MVLFFLCGVEQTPAFVWRVVWWSAGFVQGGAKPTCRFHCRRADLANVPYLFRLPTCRAGFHLPTCRANSTADFHCRRIGSTADVPVPLADVTCRSHLPTCRAGSTAGVPVPLCRGNVRLHLPTCRFHLLTLRVVSLPTGRSTCRRAVPVSTADVPVPLPTCRPRFRRAVPVPTCNVPVLLADVTCRFHGRCAGSSCRRAMLVPFTDVTCRPLLPTCRAVPRPACPFTFRW